MIPCYFVLSISAAPSKILNNIGDQEANTFLSRKLLYNSGKAEEFLLGNYFRRGGSYTLKTGKITDYFLVIKNGTKDGLMLSSTRDKMKKMVGVGEFGNKLIRV